MLFYYRILIGSPQVLQVLLQSRKSRESEQGMIRLKIKEIAEQKGFTMTRLSHRSEVSFNTIKSLFRNPYRSVNTETLERLAKALGVSPVDLIEYIPDDQQPQPPNP